MTLSSSHLGNHLLGISREQGNIMYGLYSDYIALFPLTTGKNMLLPYSKDSCHAGFFVSTVPLLDGHLRSYPKPMRLRDT